MTTFDTYDDIQEAWKWECHSSNRWRDPGWKQGGDGPMSRFFRASLDSAAEIIVSAVDASTIRAFQGMRTYKPLSIFRAWAYMQLVESENLRNRVSNWTLDTQGFRTLHDRTCRSLTDYWYRTDRTRLTFAQSRKLVDLLFKFLVKWSDLPNPARRALYWHANVPLDKYSLGAIRALWNAHGYDEIDIPSNATMGWTRPETYRSIQQFIYQAMGRMAAARIEFDVLAWHRARADPSQFLLKCK